MTKQRIIKMTTKEAVRRFIRYFKPNNNPIYTFPPKSDFNEKKQVALYFTYKDAQAIEKVVDYLEKLI